MGHGGYQVISGEYRVSTSESTSGSGVSTSGSGGERVYAWVWMFSLPLEATALGAGWGQNEPGTPGHTCRDPRAAGAGRGAAAYPDRWGAARSGRGRIPGPPGLYLNKYTVYILSVPVVPVVVYTTTKNLYGFSRKNTTGSRKLGL